MVAREQPGKLAALEAHYETGQGGTGMYLWGLPDDSAQTVRYGVQVPYLLSALVYHQLDRPVPGLDQIPADERPHAAVVFWTYRVMIGCGVFFMGLSLLAVLALWRSRPEKHPWLLKLCVLSVIPAYVANQAGWMTAEVGRQPWIVYKLLRTEHGVSHAVAASHVLWSILLFGAVYVLLFLVWVYVMNEKIQHGPLLPAPRPAGQSALEAIIEAAGDKVDPSENLLEQDEQP
jgi:cytochrome d ubiquinol oxidase subunit I